ncbi:hypothetical protein E2C01_025308 [Portunus trituberculatus]|uniref:Uncharacterized protein n=1 Tax=Portunus trituberculatus TaxID=210409 RepID=A0A5B7EFM5_PORTR|nr:hypothetical protein [Portunus trituberculatus]
MFGLRTGSQYFVSKIIPASNLDESWDTTPFPGNHQAMRWGFRLWYSLAETLVFTSRALLLFPPRLRFRNRFRDSGIRYSPCSRTLPIPRGTGFRNWFRRFRPLKEPVP